MPVDAGLRKSADTAVAITGATHRRRRHAVGAGTVTKLEEIKRIGQERGIEFFFAQFVDLYGRPSAKLVPGREPRRPRRGRRGLRRASRPARSARRRATPTSRRSPTSTASRPVPWQPNLARFACDVTVEGEPWPYCPRTILRRQLARAKELGYEFKLGLELEYFLVRRTRRRLDRDRRPSRHAREALLRHGRADAAVRLPHDGLEATATSSAGATTRTTTRTRTASSSRTSPTTTRSSAATARSSSATWSTRSPSSTG